MAEQTVVAYQVAGSQDGGHEQLTQIAIAQQLAELKGATWGGVFDPMSPPSGRLYFVPSQTFVGVDAARGLGIHTASDLFGGVVPQPVVATKTITHPLPHAGAHAPKGWSPQFSTAVADVVLAGFSAFTREDARLAGAQLLERCNVRVKRPRGIGGRGQVVAHDLAELEAALEAIADTDLATLGVVLEENLTDVDTYSVGQIVVDDIVATYWGVQRLTQDNRGREVYGGTELWVARGDYDALLALDLAEDARVAIRQARTYDAAARTAFSGFFASRRNYDVARGRDATGAPRCGVLEQSWRIGGASGIEVAGLEAFATDPRCRAIHGRCFEVYGESPDPPPDATVYFRGSDGKVGRLTKYTRVDERVDA